MLAGLIALGGCSKSPTDKAADNVRDAADNVADNIEAAASNTASNLQNQATAVQNAAENRADAVRNAADNRATARCFRAFPTSGILARKNSTFPRQASLCLFCVA